MSPGVEGCVRAGCNAFFLLDYYLHYLLLIVLPFNLLMTVLRVREGAGRIHKDNRGHVKMASLSDIQEKRDGLRLICLDGAAAAVAN